MVFQAIRTFCRFLRDSAVEQWHPPRDRVLWAPVALGAGIACYFAWPVEPRFWHGAGALLFATMLFIGVRLYARQAAGLSGAFFLMCLGFFLAQGRAMTLHAPMLDRESGITRVEGRVLDVSVSDDDKTSSKRRVTLGELAIEKIPPDQTPYSIRLTSRHVPADVVPGERIAVLAKLMPPSGPVSPDGFDYRRQAYFERIGAVGFTLGQFERLGTNVASGDALWFNQLRQRISKSIAAQLPHPESAVASALLAGERADIPPDVNQNLIDSGLYHLLSISGLHVAIVCGFVFFGLRFLMALWPWLALHCPIKKVAALAALLAGIFYMLLAGSPVPTQRAMLTTGIVLFAVMLDRSALSLRTLALAALFILALHPEALVGASFQLSFMAVLSMIVFHETVGRRWMVDGRARAMPIRFFGYFAGIVATTVLVGLATLPVILYHFGRVQIYGVLANAAAIPLTSFVVMPAGMASLLLMPLGLEGPFLKIVAWGVSLTLDVARWVASLPHAALALPALSLGPYLTSVFGVLLLCLWRGWLRYCGLALALAGFAVGAVQTKPAVIVDAQARVVAVASQGQIAYLFKRPTEYIGKNWLALWGGHEINDGRAYRSGLVDLGSVKAMCDDFACRIELPEGLRLSLVREAVALTEECAWASHIVALGKSMPLQGCAAASLTSTWDMRRAGGMAFWADGQSQAIDAVGGARFWSRR